MDDALFASLFAAIDARPDDADLRAQVAQLLLDRGRPAEALQHAAVALQHAPGHRAALQVLTRASSALRPDEPAAPAGTPAAPEEFDWDGAERQLGDQAVPPISRP